MEVDPIPEPQEFTRCAIETGHIDRAEEAAMQAIALWEERERRCLEILSRVDDAEASLARGDGIAITKAPMHRLATNVKQRGRDRLAVEKAAIR